MPINFSSAQVVKKSPLRKKTNRRNKHYRNIFVQYKLSKTFYYLLSFLFLITVSVLLYFKVFTRNMLNEIDTFPISVEPNSEYLHIRADKSYVLPGGSYSLYVSTRAKVPLPYTGYLEVSGTICDGNEQNCKSIQTAWKNYDGSNVYVNKGFVTINVPSNSKPTVNTVKFRPLNTAFNWSNTIKIGVNSLVGLEKASDYWVFSSKKVTYNGINYAYAENPTFTAQIWFEGPYTKYDPVKNITYKNIYTQYFTKSNDFGYWLSKTPWYTTRAYDSDFIWDLVYYGNKENSTFKDDFLIALGGDTV